MAPNFPTWASDLAPQLTALNVHDPNYASRFVELLLSSSIAVGASDVHLQPASKGLEIRLRLDGVLQLLGEFPRGVASDVVTRLKVLADLLTYRNDVPQEGRIAHDGRTPPQEQRVEIRVSTFPTLHGERAVVRIFAASEQYLFLDDLGLPEQVQQTLLRLLAETSGAILLTGPAGSGKTTTIYACLRELLRQSQGRRSVVTLEDPIEAALPGAAQSQVNRDGGFTLSVGLRSILRQDPEVIMIGEIRDRETAEAALQASLTGHLVLTTFHAGAATGAISRLSDMGLEPYLLRAGVQAILCQRLVRRLCDCAVPIDDPRELLGLPVKQARSPQGCEACGATGYRGRMVLAELLKAPPGELGKAILSRIDAEELERLAMDAGMVARWQRAYDAVERGLTSPMEIRRVLGFSDRG